MGHQAVLMSLRPCFASAIYSGAKRFEYRRCRVSIRPGATVLIYESSPVSLVTGMFLVSDVLNATAFSPFDLEIDPAMARSAHEYLLGARQSSALQIIHPRRFVRPLRLHDYGLPRAPQSYCFLSEVQLGRLRDYINT